MDTPQIAELVISLLTLVSIVGCGVKVAHEDEKRYKDSEKLDSM